MGQALHALGIDSMSVEDRIDLVKDIWDSVTIEAGLLPPIAAEKAELDRRLAEDEVHPYDFSYRQARVSISSIAATIASPSSTNVATFSPRFSSATETISSGCSTTLMPFTVNTGLSGVSRKVAVRARVLRRTSGTTTRRE